MDAHFEVLSGNLVLHSRGGTKGTAQATNTDYQAALRLMLERFRRSGVEITDARVDSRRVKNLPIERRRVLFPEDADVTTDELYTSLSRRMASVGRNPAFPGSGGNRTKRLRVSFGGAPSDKWIAHVAGRGDLDNVFSPDGLLSESAHDRVNEDHVHYAGNSSRPVRRAMRSAAPGTLTSLRTTESDLLPRRFTAWLHAKP